MTDPSAASAFTSLLTESRTFPPDPAFAAQANAGAGLQEEADRDVEAFWAARAGELRWERPWDRVLQNGAAGDASWFVGGTLSVAVNCVDRASMPLRLTGHGEERRRRAKLEVALVESTLRRRIGAASARHVRSVLEHCVAELRIGARRNHNPTEPSKRTRDQERSSS